MHPRLLVAAASLSAALLIPTATASSQDWADPDDAAIRPGVPGDSGSGAMLEDGKALGVVVTMGVAPYPAENGMTRLDEALDYANNHGRDLQLATAPLDLTADVQE